MTSLDIGVAFNELRKGVSLQDVDKLIVPQQQGHDKQLSNHLGPAAFNIVFEKDIGNFLKGFDTFGDVIERDWLSAHDDFSHLDVPSS